MAHRSGTERRRHIIVEGMDGSGKDTLIASLMAHYSQDPYPFFLHERASTSLGGPVANLSDWVVKDLQAMPTHSRSVYNRHPLISEPIYAPRRRVNPGLRGKWQSHAWVNLHRSIASIHAVVIICHPPFSALHANLMRTPQGHMPGVIENAAELYDEYSKLVWPGATIRYNYRKDTLLDLTKSLSYFLGRKSP